jgi:hypothetical protein
LSLVAAATGAEPLPAPFAHGEELTFEVSWLGMVAGTAVMQVEPPRLFRGVPAYHFTSRAQSTPFFSRIFPVDDRVASWARVGDLASLRFEQYLREGKKHRDEVVDFDLLLRTAISERGTVEIPPGVYDSLSAFYHVRTLELTPGTSHSLPVHSRGKNYQLRVEVLARESIKTPFGERPAIKIEPHQEHEGVFDQRGRVWIWLSDDRNRLPLMMRSSLTIGSIVARLVEFRIDHAPPASAAAPPPASD